MAEPTSHRGPGADDRAGGDGEFVAPRVAFRGPAIGAGLVLSILVGWDPLNDAVTGTGPFEDAVVRFVACVVICVGGAAFVGAVLDQSPPEKASSGVELRRHENETDRGDE